MSVIHRVGDLEKKIDDRFYIGNVIHRVGDLEMK